MQTIRNIEFFNDPEGGVMVRDTEGVHTYQPEDKMLTGALFTRIETEYPKVFKALAEIYRKSRANVNYYRFLICHRFIRCNFGRLDNRQDIDGMGGKFIDTRRALTNYTCDELYEDGFRLIVDPAPEEEIVEVTMDEIAKLKGVPVERLRVKKEDK